MFDNKLRPLVDPALTRLAVRLTRWGIGANAVTWFGFGLGICAALAIWNQYYLIGLVLLLASRLCDGLDGAVARMNAKTDLGGFLDIVLDFAFYGLIPLAFILADPSSNAVAGAVLIFVFYVNGASFLAFALMAQKRGLDESALGSKSFLYTSGLAEAGETIAVFMLFCLFPGWFSTIAFVFGAVVVITTLSRFARAYSNFR